MTEPVVDVIIPVHTAQRPIGRATASVLQTATTSTRVSVVCHNVSTSAIADALGTWAEDPRVRLLHLNDGVSSPAGPINAGLDAATAEFTALLGSDDEYEPGAIDAWVKVARRDKASVVIPPLRNSQGSPARTPPTRPFRSRKLHGVRDRLAYRTVQLGLVSRAEFGSVRMTSSLRSGEDVVQGASMWFSVARISMVRRGPSYVIHLDDASERTSTTAKPAAESLMFLDAVLAPDFLAPLTNAQRESFAIKLLRTHIMDVLGASVAAGTLAQDKDSLASAVRRILAIAPQALDILSRRESRIVEMILGTLVETVVASELALRTDFRRPANLWPAASRRVLHREAPLRFLAALALMR